MESNLQKLVGLIVEDPALKGSFVEELLQTILSGKFTDTDQDPDSSCEKVIGEMNDLDKALYTLCDSYTKRESQITSWFRNSLTSDEVIEQDKVGQMEAKLRQTRERFEIADKLRWDNIHNRFDQFDEQGSTGFGVRSGHRVVLLYGGNSHQINPLEIIFALGKGD